MIQDIKFDKQPSRHSWGRNGFILTTGVQIATTDFLDYDAGEGPSVEFYPITSKGVPTRSVRVSISRDALPDIIKVLQSLL